jgi:hypothetical protein
VKKDDMRLLTVSFIANYTGATMGGSTKRRIPHWYFPETRTRLLHGHGEAVGQWGAAPSLSQAGIPSQFHFTFTLQEETPPYKSS